MNRKIDRYLNQKFKTPCFLDLSQIFILTMFHVAASLGAIVRIELYRRILQAVLSADGPVLLRELGLLAAYEALYSGMVHLSQYESAKIQGKLLRQLLDNVLTKNEKLRSLGNCPLGPSDRFSMASEDCQLYVSSVLSKASLFADFVIVPLYIAYGCSLNPGITAAITGTSIALSVLNRKNKRKLYGYNQEYGERFAHWANFLWKAVDNLEVIKVFLDKKKVRAEQKKRNQALDDVEQNRLKTFLDMSLIEESSDMGFTLFILCASFLAVAAERIAMSDILAMVESLTAVQKAIFALPEKFVQLNELESIAGRISRFEALEEDNAKEDNYIGKDGDNVQEDRNVSRENDHIHGDKTIGKENGMEHFRTLTLRQVSFSYEEKEVLKDIDFTFERGKFYILVGRSGCGKSTLLKVLSKLVPYTGHVRWNGTELREIDRQALYRKLFYQPQSQIFIEDTIRENICLEPGGEEKRYQEILDRFFIRDIFRKNNFDDTQVLNYRGAPLSSGESQIVSMAGILYRPRDVVLLDEVFSAVDPAKEQVFFRELASLARAGKTVILVSHRLSNLEAAEKILFLEEGRICETGNLEELLSVSRGQAGSCIFGDACLLPVVRPDIPGDGSAGAGRRSA